MTSTDTVLTARQLDEYEALLQRTTPLGAATASPGMAAALLAYVRRLQAQRQFLIAELAKRDAATGDGDRALREFLAGYPDETETAAEPTRTLTEGEYNAAWHAVEGAAGEHGADPGTVLHAVLDRLRIGWQDTDRPATPAAAGPDPVCGDANDGDWCELDPGHEGHHRADTAEWAQHPAAVPAAVVGGEPGTNQ